MNVGVELRASVTASPQSVSRRGRQGIRLQPCERLLKGARNFRRRNSPIVALVRRMSRSLAHPCSLATLRHKPWAGLEPRRFNPVESPPRRNAR